LLLANSINIQGAKEQKRTTRMVRLQCSAWQQRA